MGAILCNLCNEENISIFIAVAMSDVYSPPERVAVESHCRGMETYKAMYKESVEEPHK